VTGSGGNVIESGGDTDKERGRTLCACCACAIMPGPPSWTVPGRLDGPAAGC